MIPQFPDFKHVEIADRKAVEAHTHRFDPYSDFNFTSLWAWDTSNERMISELNGNLVVKFTDYSTHEPFLSFLGDNETEHTARTLIDYSRANGMPAELRLVPEVSTKNIRPSVLKMEEDRDNFDYIYSVQSLASLKGNAYMSKRGRSNKFRRENPSIVVEVIDLANTDAQTSILSVIGSWEKGKVDGHKSYEIEHERAAITRLCQTADSHDLAATGIFHDRTLIGFSIEEMLPSDFAICHFWKADTSRAGIFDFLMQEKAKHLDTMGVLFLNYEQDLGLPSLRQSKSSYRVVHFLMKYTVLLG